MPTHKSLAKGVARSQTGSSFLFTSRIIAAVAVAILCALGVWYLLSGDRIPLSKTGYDLAAALYAACNLEDPKRLSLVKSKLEQESLSPEERSRVTTILDLAQSGQWQDAAMQARRLLESQDNL